MRSQITIALVLAALVATGCDQTAPTDTQDSPANIFPVLTSDGNNGASRWIPDDACGAFDAEGNLIFPNDCRNEISTNSNNENAMAVIRASGIPNSTGRVVHFDAYNPPYSMYEIWGLDEPPLPCNLFDADGEPTLFTVKWSATISPSGEGVFNCHYQKKWEWVPPEGWEPPF